MTNILLYNTKKLTKHQYLKVSPAVKPFLNINKSMKGDNRLTMKKEIKWIFILIYGIILILLLPAATACHSKEKDDYIPSEPKESVRIIYTIDDTILYTTQDMTKDILNNIFICSAFNSEIKEMAGFSSPFCKSHDLILQGKWLYGDIVINSPAQLADLSGDVVLQMKVETIFLARGRKIGAIIWHDGSGEITYPTVITFVGKNNSLNLKDITTFRQDETVILSAIDYYNEGLISEGLSNLLYTNVKVNRIIINANLFNGNVIRKFTFRVNAYIKEIVIVGNVKKIETLSFTNLNNLKRVIITETVQEIEKDAIWKCNNANIICMAKDSNSYRW